MCGISLDECVCVFMNVFFSSLANIEFYARWHSRTLQMVLLLLCIVMMASQSFGFSTDFNIHVIKSKLLQNKFNNYTRGCVVWKKKWNPLICLH